MTTDRTPYMTIAECAGILSVSESFVRREIAQGKLQASQFGTRLRIHPDEFAAYEEACRCPAKRSPNPAPAANVAAAVSAGTPNARAGGPPRSAVALDAGMCRLLLKALDGNTFYPHICWLLTTGMRVGELRGLRWVNVTAQEIRIVEQRLLRNRHTPAPLKTERQIGEGRIIPLASQLLALTPRGESELVFPHSSGAGSFDENTLRRHLYKACKAAKVPHVTIHDLRHTANSGWADLGLSESGCAALLGHRKQTMTARYTHRSADALRPFVEEWAGLVLGESGGKIARLGT